MIFLVMATIIAKKINHIEKSTGISEVRGQ